MEKKEDKLYKEELEYQKKIAQEKKKFDDMCAAYPDIQAFLQKRAKWRAFLRGAGTLTVLATICVMYDAYFSDAFTHSGGAGPVYYSIYLLLSLAACIGMAADIAADVRFPCKLLIFMVFVLAFNLLPLLYHEAGCSSFGGFLAGIGYLLLKAGAALPGAAEGYVLDIFLEYGIWNMVQGALATVFYAMTFGYALAMVLPGSKRMYQRIDDLYDAWCEKQEAVPWEGAQESLSEKQRKKAEKREHREQLAKKFLDIYEKHPDIGRYMQARGRDLWSGIRMSVMVHIAWAVCAAGKFPVSAILFSLLCFIGVAAASYSCLSEKPNRAYLLLAAVGVVFFINLLPVVRHLAGDTLIFYMASALYCICYFNLGISFGIPESCADVLIETFAKYGDGMMLAFAGWAGLCYIFTLKSAIQMVLPKNMEIMRRLKELSDHYPDI